MIVHYLLLFIYLNFKLDLNNFIILLSIIIIFVLNIVF